MSQEEREDNKQQKQREETLKGWDSLDTRFKLSMPIWAECTRAAFAMGMSEEERLKLIAINLADNNLRMADQILQIQKSMGMGGFKITVPEDKLIKPFNGQN